MEPSMPHVCGDEPAGFLDDFVFAYVCPTYVGMNRQTAGPPTRTARMPHVCGDEPRVKLFYLAALVYAPRMWG